MLRDGKVQLMSNCRLKDISITGHIVNVGLYIELPGKDFFVGVDPVHCISEMIKFVILR